MWAMGRSGWHATKIENIVPSANKAKLAHNAFYNKEASYAHHLQTFGKQGIVHDAQMIKNMLDNHRETCIFMGHANDHMGNVYHMFNPQMKSIWITHDIRWVKLHTAMEIKKTIETILTVETVLDEDNNDMEIAPIDHGTPADANNMPVAIATTAATMGNANQIDGQVLCEMKHLGGWFNPTALEYIACSQKNKNLEMIDEEVNEDDAPEDATTSRAGREVANATLSHVVSKFAFYSIAKVIEKQAAQNGEDCHFVEPKNFCEAFDHPDPIQCEKWCMAIHKEFSDMMNHGIWHKVKWSQVPAGWRCI